MTTKFVKMVASARQRAALQYVFVSLDTLGPPVRQVSDLYMGEGVPWVAGSDERSPIWLGSGWSQSDFSQPLIFTVPRCG